MHPTADIIIAEDGQLSKCDLCGFRTKNLHKHYNSKTCLQAQRRRENERKQDEQARANEIIFYVNGKKLQ